MKHAFVTLSALISSSAAWAHGPHGEMASHSAHGLTHALPVLAIIGLALAIYLWKKE